MYSKIVFILIFFFSGVISSPKGVYHKEYHSNGQLKAQGWKIGALKEKYWKYYYFNGKIKEEGHYKMNLKDGYWHFYNERGKIKMQGHMLKGKKVKWWLFYNENEKITHKCQMQDGIINGYCLKYKNEELTSAEKFQNGKKIKEWFSLASFKKENKLSDLK